MMLEKYVDQKSESLYLHTVSKCVSLLRLQLMSAVLDLDALTSTVLAKKISSLIAARIKRVISLSPISPLSRLAEMPAPLLGTTPALDINSVHEVRMRIISQNS